MRLVRLIACGATALACGTAQAAIIDFQNLPAGYGTGTCTGVGAVADSGGFRFTGNPADPALYACNDGALQGNATRALINANQRSILTMAPVLGGTFSLDSFFAGGRTEDGAIGQPVTSYGVAEGIEVRGHLPGGGSIVATFGLDTVAPYAWQQFLLPTGFVGLTSVVFTALGRDNPEFLIDDIAVNTRVAAVPEPGSAALLGAAALSAVGAWRRRHTRCDDTATP